MKIQSLLITLTLGLVAAGACLAADNKIEQDIRDLVSQWSKAAETNDLDKTLSFYADDAVVLPAHKAIATTKEAIRTIFQNMLTTPGLKVGWKASKVDVAASGDLAYTMGPYHLTAPDDSGKTTTDDGKYVAVWKKQPDGSWKIVIDIWNTDLPLPAPAEKK